MHYKNVFKKLIPEFGIIVGFIVISFIYFSPVLEGKKLPQMDNIHAKGMSQELVEFEKNNSGESSQWTNSMFGGMPAYQIKGNKSQNIFVYFARFLRFWLPYTTVAILFNYLFGFYILLRCFNVNKWLSAVGATAFAFASYNIIIIAVGHITKAYAIAYMAPIIGGVFLMYRKKYILGGIITLIFVGIQIATTHIQINYYTVLLIGIIVLVELIIKFKNRDISHFIKATLILILIGLLAVLPETKKLWSTYEYTKYSIRGDQVLESKKDGNKDGLEKDYALSWSYGKMESFTFLIPNFNGGATVPFDKNTKIYEQLTQNGVQPQTAEAIAKSTYAYWGSQPSTAAPVYFGSIIMFLFILGIFIIKDKYKWWIIAATVFSILLSWGNNFEVLTNIFFNYFPMYDKFRTVSMILVVANVMVVLMAFLVLKEIYQGNINKDQLKKPILYSLEIVGGVLLIFILFGGAIFNFESNNDLALINQLQASNWPSNLINVYKSAVQEDRLAMLRSDSFRSLIFILLATGTLYLFINKKIKNEYFIAALGILILVDLWGVDRRYLKSDNFITAREEKNQFKLTSADSQILQDKSLDYRVLNLTRNPFADAYTPYFHKSIGGYHGAKFRRYQDLIEYQISPSIQNIARTLNSQEGQARIEEVLSKQNVINMLNTKYIILSENYVLPNYHVYGNAWFVKNHKLVNTANEEMQLIGTENLNETAIIQNEFKDKISSVDAIGDSLSGNIRLKSYKPNQLVYESNSESRNIAVFSEIYYPEGWNAFIDGEKADHFRVNYILRAMVIPEGNHEIEFRFEPNSYIAGKKISLISSIIVILLVIAGIVVLARQSKQIDVKE